MNTPNLYQQGLICSFTRTDRSSRPAIVATRTYPQHPAQITDLMTLTILSDERVPYLRSLAKYAAAFFRISRSSLTAFSSCLNRLNSLISSLFGLPDPLKRSEEHTSELQ